MARELLSPDGEVLSIDEQHPSPSPRYRWSRNADVRHDIASCERPGRRQNVLLAKERYLLHRFFVRLFCGRSRGEEESQGREVGVERVAQGRLVQRGGRVVDGKDQKALGGLARLSVDARDRFTRKELPHSVPPEGDDDARLQDLEVAKKPHVARRYLFW